MTALGYKRKIAERKVFSTDPAVIQERLDFAREAIDWIPERLYRQMFTDKVWVYRGNHIISYVTVEADDSDRL